MEYKLLSSRSTEELTKKVNEHLDNGWNLMGGHKVVETHRQNRYRGQQHIDTQLELEYSISMVKDTDKIL